MPPIPRFFNPWAFGGLSGALATALYFGSDDWARDLRLGALVVVWGLYFFGLGNLVRALWRTPQRGLLSAGGVFLGVLVVVGGDASGPRPLGLEIWAYHLTHPRALWLLLMGQAVPLDTRAVVNWSDWVLTPYLWMWGVTALIGLLTALGAALRQRR